MKHGGKTQRPNILLITTDQQRHDTINAAGNREIFTPHLDWLCDQGTRFSRCYSDCPVCMPARATIMTGRYAHSHGLTGNSESIRPMERNPTLPQILTSAGYQTRAQGKMHFFPLRRNYGFEHMEILPDYYRHMKGNRDRGIPMDHGMGQNEMDPVISTVSESNSLTHWIVDRSIDFLETRDESRPFFLWTGFSKPHPPFDPCREYWEIYSGLSLSPPVDGDWSKEVSNIPPQALRGTWSLNNAHRLSAERLIQTKRAYYATISQVDYNLGILFARMREMGLLDNTWIIFTSDHGEMLGDHHLGAKALYFDGAAHIPLIIRPPVPSPSVSSDLVCLADLLPTCLSIAGIEPPEGIDGRSLIERGVVGETGGRRTHLFGEVNGIYGIIGPEHSYHFFPRGGDELCFHICVDPRERIDLVRRADPAVEEYRTRMVTELERIGSPAVRNGKLVSIGSPPTEDELHARAWPGFHSRSIETDVLH